MRWSCLAAADLAPHAEASLHPILAILPACTLYWPFCKPALYWPGLQIHCFRCKSGQKVKRLTHSYIEDEFWNISISKCSKENVAWEAWTFPLSSLLAQIFSRLRRVFVLRQRRISASLKLHGLHLANSTVDILWATHLFMILKNFSKQKKQDSLTKEINRFPPDDLVLTL